MQEIENFLSAKLLEDGVSGNTVIAYRRDLNDFMLFCQAKKIDLRTVTNKDITAYMDSLARAYMSGKTLSRRLSAIREFYRFLFADKEIKTNPAFNLDGVKSSKSLPKYLSEQEVTNLIVSCALVEGEKNRVLYTCLVEVLYATGMRVSELASLPLSCVVKASSSLQVTGKGGKTRLVPLNQKALTAITDWLLLRASILRKQKSKWLFPSDKSASGHITRDYIFKILKKLAVLADIPYEKVSPHILRHSFASHLIAHNADLRAVQQMLGHSDIATTEIYTHIQADKKKSLVFSSHPLMQAKSTNDDKTVENEE